MNSTLKRKKSIDSHAASISAWCAVFDWPSIVAAFSVSRHGPAAARRRGAARRRAPPTASATSPPRPSRRRRSPAATCSALALVDVREHVLACRAASRPASLAGRDVLAADHERDLDALVAHLLEPQLQACALGAARARSRGSARCGRAGGGRSRGCSCAVHYGGGPVARRCGSAAPRRAASPRSRRRSRSASICSCTTSTTGPGCTRRACRDEFGSLTMDEPACTPPSRCSSRFVSTSRHRFRLVLQDLRELPDEPAAVVEGPQLFPTSSRPCYASPTRRCSAPDADGW